MRAPFLAANKIDPEAAEPLMLFYRTFPAQGVKPTKNALNGLTYAVALAPQDDRLRMEVVGELIDIGQLEEARSFLRTIALSPHQGKRHDSAVAIYEALVAGNQAAAKERWAAAQKYYDED